MLLPQFIPNFSLILSFLLWIKIPNYILIINSNVYKMLNPTFASFKTVKQPVYPSTTLYEANSNIQPKSFYDLKFSSSNTQIQFHHHHHKPEKVNMSNNPQYRKGTIHYHSKKNQSQLSMAELENNLQPSEIRSMVMKPKLHPKTYVTSRKNLGKIEIESTELQVTRPSITGPSLLKNRSFINSLTSQLKQNSQCSSSGQQEDDKKKSGKFEEVGCSDSFDRNSQQYSINESSSSRGDKDSFSCFSQNKFDNSLSLKNSCDSSKIVDKTINFSRKTGRTMYKGPTRNYIRNEPQLGIYFTTISKLPQQIKSSHELEYQNNKNYQQKYVENLCQISMSKKINNYKKYKEYCQIRKIVLEEFLLVQEIGEGRYGKVYMAKHKYTNFICALKTVSKQKIKLQNIQQAFIRQIKIQMYLTHPNIVKLYGFFSDEQNIYLIMQCCFSGHLLKLIKHRKIFQQTQILQIISNVFQAVSFLHCHGIIHRDLKPQNIVIQNEVYKICDFGWAAYTKGDSRTTFCGTPLYVCPEVLKGNLYDEKADVWGLGVLTYELAYGRVPFPIWSQSDMVKIVKDPVYFPTWTSISDKMQHLIKSMLNKDPTKRLSINEIMASSLIAEYVGKGCGLKSEIDTLF